MEFAKDDCQILVIDNSARRPSVAALDGWERLRRLADFRLIHEPIPGLLAARHRGAKEAKSDILVFIDDDVRVAPSWLGAILETFRSPDVHFVTGRNLPEYRLAPPDWLESFWRRNQEGASYCGYLSLLDFGEAVCDIDPVYVWGLNFAIRKQTLMDLGGFHPDGVPWELRRFRGDGETAVGRTAKEAGLRAVYNPDALVHHLIPPSRLTVEYFERRAYLQGISDSYAAIRREGTVLEQSESNPWDWKTPARKVKRVLRSAIPRSRTEKIRSQVKRAHRAGYDFHQNEVRNDPKLLAWVLKEDYWDYRLPEGSC